MDDEIRRILTTYGRLHIPDAALKDDDDLFRAGMTSLANVTVMLALEEAFDVEFPETMLSRNSFVSIAAIRSAVTSLTRLQQVQDDRSSHETRADCRRIAPVYP